MATCSTYCVLCVLLNFVISPQGSEGPSFKDPAGKMGNNLISKSWPKVCGHPPIV